MALRIWLLVEWVDESNMFSEYSVLSVNTRAYNVTEFEPGNLIMVSANDKNPRQAKIIRMSESKHHVTDVKNILERQEKQLKDMLQLYKTTNDTSNLNNIAAHVVMANDDNTSEDSESEADVVIPDRRLLKLMKFSTKRRAQYSRTPEPNRAISVMSNHQRRRSLASSTLLPGTSAPDNKKLSLEQRTQTEGVDPQTLDAKIETLEADLKTLYTRLTSLEAQVHILNVHLCISESEHNDGSEQSHGDSWTNDNNTGYMDQNDASRENAVHLDTEQVTSNCEEPMNLVNSNAKANETSNTVHVRRMSAQTTNHVEAGPANEADLVPIGNGHARVPARLLNHIDWTSYTNATRQLLLAIFPRSVLATHSLTGKPSPAFVNKPPKKILDPQLVADIEDIVTTRCGVRKNLVRKSITIKCTDEAKLYRNRQTRRTSHQNQENVPPLTSSSDELSIDMG